MTRGKGWTEPETHLMLDVVGEVLPLGGNHWEKAQQLYNERKAEAWSPRDMDCIRRKFKTLRNNKKPTGDPMCPEAVRRAKRLQASIESTMAVTHLESECEDVDDEVPEAKEDEEEEKPPRPVLQATGRTGLSADELAELGNVASHTTQRRRKIDEMLQDVEESVQSKKRQSLEKAEEKASMMAMLMMMEERRIER
ncbi:hypothetical protein DAPPUDRAFT_346168, partial [Daphnia pulex]